MRIRYALAALAFGLMALPAQAQESLAVSAAKDFVRAQTASFAASDLDDLHTTDAYFDRRSGATMVYLAQRHAGIEIHGAVAPVAVAASGKAHGLAPRRFVSDVARRANATAPVLGAAAARAAAESAARGAFSARPRNPHTLADDHSDHAPAPTGPFAYELSGEPRLVYQPAEDGSLRLAWSVTFEADRGTAQLWTARVDAVTGAVLALDDLVARHQRSHAQRALTSPRDAVARSLAPIAEAQDRGRLGGPSYRVVPFPFESPSHGDVALVSDPADAVASPNGWHDTGATTYTVTRGNNVYAYLDRDANNQPDPGSSPDGGAGLVFDFPFTEGAPIEENAKAAVVNAFYWSNIVHDVFWHYGFDEASGNFQQTNFTGQGAGNDPVRAEALDGSGTDNANFSTPADGGSGRMQMFEWTAPGLFEVTAPASIARTYPSGGSQFGRFGVVVSGTLVAAQRSTGGFSDGCTPDVIGNIAELSGNVALIERGSCNFVDKARVAQDAGAIAVVIANCSSEGNPNCSSSNPDEGIINMALPQGQEDDVTIPALFVQASTGAAVRAPSEPVSVTVGYANSRDSDFDSGIIAHEIGHGVSNRLTAGPSNTGCLSNGEQMGEGWSDYLGIVLTAQDDNDRTRGVGTYSVFEPTDGTGIRPRVYTSDTAVNDFTYQNVIDQAGSSLSVPHGLGFVWATMLWDMTLLLQDEMGFGDIADPDATGGNNVALQLVMQGMKMQPCFPGFVDGRDAILEADTLLYDGANSNTIWTAFAARGLGFSADQGLSTNANDGTAAFDMPPIVSAESDARDGAAALAVAGANPFRNRSAVALELGSTEAVTVAVTDALGRHVRTLHDGELAGGQRHAFTLDADGLAPGVYVVRAQGETFSVTRRVTVLR